LLPDPINSELDKVIPALSGGRVSWARSRLATSKLAYKEVNSHREERKKKKKGSRALTPGLMFDVSPEWVNAQGL
jgi:hypothetical protein